jgi:UDP-N-acetyl-alpha-D-muramoyl-L-alanyl-L-glutamate epimerase
MPRATSFTFGTYHVDTNRSIVSFTYHVGFRSGKTKTYTDRLFLPDVSPESWEKVPPRVLEPTLQALLLMLGINYWAVFPTRAMHIEGFTLTREQAEFWDSLYLNGLGEYFYLMQMDFRDLIKFPYDETASAPAPARIELPRRALLLNGAGKDSILSAEILKEANMPFDFFAFAPSFAHERIAKLVGAKTIRVTRRRDPRLNLAAALHSVSAAYPSVSTFTFIATLLAELLGYDSIIFSNERSADIGNLTYRGLSVNHQWCKSSEAEKMTNEYIQRYITPSLSTHSLLREYSELEIVRRFVEYPQYLYAVTSCNSYFCFSRLEQRFLRTPYWCKECPKCVFLFACFAAFLPKKEVVSIFGGNLYARRRRLPLVRRILGIEGFKPLDCVGEPEEMILAMEYAARRKEYAGEPAMRLFEERFPADYAFDELARSVFTDKPPKIEETASRTN